MGSHSQARRAQSRALGTEGVAEDCKRERDPELPASRPLRGPSSWVSFQASGRSLGREPGAALRTNLAGGKEPDCCPRAARGQQGLPSPLSLPSPRERPGRPLLFCATFLGRQGARGMGPTLPRVLPPAPQGKRSLLSIHAPPCSRRQWDQARRGALPPPALAAQQLGEMPAAPLPPQGHAQGKAGRQQGWVSQLQRGGEAKRGKGRTREGEESRGSDKPKGGRKDFRSSSSISRAE